MVVLPSSGSDEVSTMDRGALPALTNCRLVRRARNASAYVWWGLSSSMTGVDAAGLS